jgi:hypothetical protein
MLLQTVPTAGVFDSLIQYGVLGIATLGLGWACWTLLQRQLETEERLNTKVNELEKKFNSYIDNDYAEVKNLVESNRKAYLELRDMIVISNKK